MNPGELMEWQAFTRMEAEDQQPAVDKNDPEKVARRARATQNQLNAYLAKRGGK